MNVYEGIDGLKRIPAGAVMSIGNFDGLHRGHMRIIETMKSLRPVKDDAPLALVTFEPHPLTVLRPQLAPPRLTPYPVKQKSIEKAGVDALVVLPPTREVLDLTAEQFWGILRDEVRPRHLVEGDSFNFGKGRGGTIQRLREWAAGSAVQLHVIDAVEVALLDLSVVDVNSSLIRWLISYGRVRDAAICLGRPYMLQGAVVRGYGRGRQIGIPTANIDCKDQLIPPEGVYAGRCTIAGTTYAAGVSIGTMPTFGENRLQVEAHLLGFDGDLYDEVIDLELIDWLRGQVRFNGIEELKRQLAVDFAETRQRMSLNAAAPIAAVQFL
jgi:riboflavin kinase/FMN adenylyltransferase